MRRFLPLLLLLSLPARAETPAQIANPLQTRGSWVADNAGVISAADEKRINAILSPLQRKTGAEVAIVTVNSLDGLTVEQFAVDLARRWRVGRTGKDNGVLILAAIKDRKSRIEVGYGLEGELTDGKAGEILHEKVTPLFKSGDYSGGLYAGALAVAQVVYPSLLVPADATPPDSSTEVLPALPRATQPSYERPTASGSYPGMTYPSRGGGLLVALMGLLVLLFPMLLFAGMIWFFTAAMRRPLRCSKCRAPVQQLSETAELGSLSPVQQFEQQIGARDYRVWHCEKCQHEDITAHDLPYSQFVQCPTCHHQTASSLVETVRQPTHLRGGQERVILSCQWPACKRSNFYNRPTPPTPRGGYGRGYGRGSSGGDLLTGIVLGSLLNNNHSGGNWGSGGGFGGSSGDSEGSSSGGGFDSGPSDFGGGDFGGGGASDSW